MIRRRLIFRLHANRATAGLNSRRRGFMTRTQHHWVDKTESLARLHKPGSLHYVLRPPGWGKTTMLRSLADLLRGGAAAKKCFSEDTWIRQHRSLLFRQPAMLPLVLSLSPAALVREPFDLQLRRQLVDLVVSNDGSSYHRASSDLDASKDLVVHMIERLERLSHAARVHRKV